jgi:hypothetical protein
MGRGAWRFGVVLAAACSMLLLMAGSASATFHLIKVKEVFPGTAAQPDSDYVELQAYAPFQNQIQFGQLRIFNANGTTASTFPSVVPTGDPVSNNANNATALIADSGFGAVFSGVTPDRTDSNLDLSPAGGAVCWPVNSTPIDCVSWGDFTGNSLLPSSAGSPFQGSGTLGAIGDGKAIVRSIAPGCPTLLEDSDDTNNSAGDFSEAATTPRPNSAPITEVVCGSPAGGGPAPTPATTPKKRKKCKKHKRSPGAGSGSPTTGGGNPAYSAKKKKCKKKRK